MNWMGPSRKLLEIKSGSRTIIIAETDENLNKQGKVLYYLLFYDSFIFVKLIQSLSSSFF